jgi:ribosomal-protein-alanine N-acetyltransferase
MIHLETPRLVLRPFSPEDAADVYEYGKDPRVGPIAGWQPHKSVEESREIIKTVFSGDDVAALVLKETGRVIGSVGLIGDHPVGEDASCPDDELGYAMNPTYWAQGLMPEAAEAVVRWCFEQRGLERLWCGYYEGNGRSQRVMEKCGFTYAFSRWEYVALMGEYRIANDYLLTKADFLRR